MTYKEALNFNQNWTEEQAFNDLERYLLREELPAMKAVAICMRATEKQIPKKIKVRVFDDETDEGKPYKVEFRLCGVCEEPIGLRSHNFCPNCGQALDWSKEE